MQEVLDDLQKVSLSKIVLRHAVVGGAGADADIAASPLGTLLHVSLVDSFAVDEPLRAVLGRVLRGHLECHRGPRLFQKGRQPHVRLGFARGPCCSESLRACACPNHVLGFVRSTAERSRGVERVCLCGVSSRRRDLSVMLFPSLRFQRPCLAPDAHARGHFFLQCLRALHRDVEAGRDAVLRHTQGHSVVTIHHWIGRCVQERNEPHL